MTRAVPRGRKRSTQPRRQASPSESRPTDAAASTDAKIIAALQRRRKHGIGLRELPRAARLTPAESTLAEQRISHLIQTGLVVPQKRGRQLVLAATLGLLRGTIDIHPDGYAFLRPEHGVGGDYYVSPRCVRPAMHGDRVVAAIERTKRGRAAARVLEVVARANERVVGTYHAAPHRGALIRPYDDKIPYLIVVHRAHRASAKPGDVVVGHITRYPDDNHDIEAEITAVLGPAGNPNVEVEAIIHRHGLPLSFPAPALAQAAAIPQSIPETALTGRLDLRHHQLVTIDGENARDFDDAVAIEERASGFRLIVSIADVSHYVPAGSALDDEAFRRGTSVYLPDRVIPMLPEPISNGVCSLNPGVDRLTLTVLIDFDANARVTHTAFSRSVIRSSARLTYTDVRRVLVDKDGTARARLAQLTPSLESMERLCRLLAAARANRGSLDFDLPEAELVLDLTGRAEAIVRAERHVGHRIIEEFMLAANEAVARHLNRHRVPFLHRVHEPPDPDVTAELAKTLQPLGFQLAASDRAPQPADFQRVLKAVQEKPQEHFVNTLILRSLKQARYAAFPLGHFGLASALYTHFTSPIRRYPDLVIHRILTDLLNRKPLPETLVERWTAALPGIATQSSTTERTAMDVEREVIALKKAEFMLDKIGQRFAGHISGVQRFGFFVELSEFFVEGLVHLSTLPPDDYTFVARAHLLTGRRTGTAFRLGDPVTVVVTSADPAKRRIDFSLAVGNELDAPILGYLSADARRSHRSSPRPLLKSSPQ